MKCYTVRSFDGDIFIVHADIGRRHRQGSPWNVRKVEHAALHKIHKDDEQTITGSDYQDEFQHDVLHLSCGDRLCPPSSAVPDGTPKGAAGAAGKGTEAATRIPAPYRTRPRGPSLERYFVDPNL